MLPYLHPGSDVHSQILGAELLDLLLLCLHDVGERGVPTFIHRSNHRWSPEEKSSNTEIHEKLWLDFRVLVRTGSRPVSDRIRIGPLCFKSSCKLPWSLNFLLETFKKKYPAFLWNFFANFCYKTFGPDWKRFQKSLVPDPNSAKCLDRIQVSEMPESGSSFNELLIP